MKQLSNYILERNNSPVITQFNAAQVKLIQKNFIDAVVSVESSESMFRNIKLYRKQGTTHVSFEYASARFQWEKDKPEWKKSEGWIAVLEEGNEIAIGHINLYVNDPRRGSTLVDMTYKNGHTTMVFDVDRKERYLDDIRIKGTVTITIPGNIVDVKGDWMTFDRAGYYTFMNKQYNIDNEEDILFWSSSFQNDKLFIEVHLVEGKGYGSHARRKDYVFTLKNGEYRCDEKLSPTDSEHKIVKKFASGVTAFLGKGPYPDKVCVTIFQELD